MKENIEQPITHRDVTDGGLQTLVWQHSFSEATVHQPTVERINDFDQHTTFTTERKISFNVSRTRTRTPHLLHWPLGDCQSVCLCSFVVKERVVGQQLSARFSSTVQGMQPSVTMAFVCSNENHRLQETSS